MCPGHLYAKKVKEQQPLSYIQYEKQNFPTVNNLTHFLKAF